MQRLCNVMFLLALLSAAEAKRGREQGRDQEMLDSNMEMKGKFDASNATKDIAAVDKWKHPVLRDCGRDGGNNCWGKFDSGSGSGSCWLLDKYGKQAKDNVDGNGNQVKGNCDSYNGYPWTWCTKDPKWSDWFKSPQKYVAAWTKTKLGKWVTSTAGGSGRWECWDLAMAAVEAAKGAGFSVPCQGCGTYTWSNKWVYPQNAQPGDIAQFQSWQQSNKVFKSDGSWYTSTVSTGYRHTAVVVEGFDGECFTTYDQNPAAVHETKYCPNRKTSGKVWIYRLR